MADFPWVIKPISDSKVQFIPKSIVHPKFFLINQVFILSGVRYKIISREFSFHASNDKKSYLKYFQAERLL